MNLNDKVRDKITAYQGVVTAKCMYAFGETRYLIESVDTTNRPIEYWYEESRLELVEE